MKKISKIIFINIFIITSILGIIELIAGRWLGYLSKNIDYIQIPGLITNQKLKFDARVLYDSQEPVVIIYERDKFGYRSNDLNSKKSIVLTIGGSTTDQKYVTEGKTWQDLLDSKLTKYDFVNGGVDGQSSYGHLKSINNWHSKYLNYSNLTHIIFYTGINDIRLIKNNYSDWDYAQSKKQYLKWFLKDNSFFISKYYVLKNKIRYLKSKNKNIDPFSSHSAREIDFEKEGKRFEFNEDLNLIDYSNYKEIFSNLLLDTRNNFPNTKILIIQQQVPGCKFESKYIVYDRHPYDAKRMYGDNVNYCLELLKVYQLQENILSKLTSITNINLLPMYLNDVIQDDGVYDYVHTNDKGSESIADYIKSVLSD